MTRRRRLRIWLGLGERCGDKKQPDKRFEKMGKVFIFKEISSIKYGRQKNERDWPQLRSKSSTWRRWTGPASPRSTSSSPPGPGRAPGRWCRPPGASPATSSGPRSWPPAHRCYVTDVTQVTVSRDWWLLYLQDITIFERKTYFRTRQESVFMGIITEQAPNIILKAYFDFRLM